MLTMLRWVVDATLGHGLGVLIVGGLRGVRASAAQQQGMAVRRPQEEEEEEEEGLYLQEGEERGLIKDLNPNRSTLALPAAR